MYNSTFIILYLNSFIFYVQVLSDHIICNVHLIHLFLSMCLGVGRFIVNHGFKIRMSPSQHLSIF